MKRWLMAIALVGCAHATMGRARDEDLRVDDSSSPFRRGAMRREVSDWLVKHDWCATRPRDDKVDTYQKCKNDDEQLVVSYDPNGIMTGLVIYLPYEDETQAALESLADENVLTHRYGEPTEHDGDRAIWRLPNETIGIASIGHYVVETHQPTVRPYSATASNPRTPATSSP
jgi:hypothetical protein